MNLNSNAFDTNDDWYEIWTDGKPRNSAKSWAEQMSYVKTNEILQDKNAFSRFINIGKYQTKLLPPFEFIENYIRTSSPVGGVLVAHVPKFTPDFVNEANLTFVDYYVTLSAVDLEGANYDSLKTNTLKDITNEPEVNYVFTETTELGYPTLLVTYDKKTQDGENNGAVRQYTMFPQGKNYGVQLFVNSTVEEFNAGLKDIADKIIAGIVLSDD